jgi:7-cyano-7-deazaguanine reductase
MMCLPRLLCPIHRATQRQLIGLTGKLPFLGADLWTAFELSWLNPRGKPQVALAHFSVPCESVNLIESTVAQALPGQFQQHTICRCLRGAAAPAR